LLSRNIETFLLDKVLQIDNIIGYSRTFKKRIKESTGETVDEECIRIYVKEKYPMKILEDREVIPRRIEDIPTDIYTAKEWKAPLKGLLVPKIEKKTSIIRPLVAGISIGNMSISAGTFGYFYKDKKGRIIGGTNAHVNSEDPSKDYSNEKRIVQPGVYDGGNKENIIGEYLWHQKINPIFSNSNCDLSKLVVKTLNGISKFLNRNTRFKTYTEFINNIDFGTFSLDTDYKIGFIDYNIEEGFLGVGHGFAGSDTTSLVCKGSYIKAKGYSPINTSFIEVKEGETVYKTGRTSCFSSAKVIDESGVSQVNYGNFVALFKDIIITNGPLLKPGDSGSFVFKIENNK